jgi:hypothetical protein
MSVYVSVRPTVRTEHLISHEKDFHEIRYFDCFLENLLRKFRFDKI